MSTCAHRICRTTEPCRYGDPRAPEVTHYDRNDTIQILRRELRRRSGKAWSVTAGRGTSWGWITITAPPSRQTRFGSMTEEDQAELSALLGKAVHHQGENVPASSAYRAEYVDRARGVQPATVGTPYWD